MLLLSRLELSLVLLDSSCLHCAEELYGCQAGCCEDWISLESVNFGFYVEIDYIFIIRVFQCLS